MSSGPLSCSLYTRITWCTLMIRISIILIFIFRSHVINKATVYIRITIISEVQVSVSKQFKTLSLSFSTFESFDRDHTAYDLLHVCSCIPYSQIYQSNEAQLRVYKFLQIQTSCLKIGGPTTDAWCCGQCTSNDVMNNCRISEKVRKKTGLTVESPLAKLLFCI